MISIIAISTCFFLLSQSMAMVTADLLQAERSEIKIRRSTDDNTTGTIQELIIGVANATDLNVIPLDLFDEQELKRIEASKISTVPKIFDLNTKVDSGTKKLNITISSAGATPGVYVGKLYIINASTQFTIPITLTIHYPIWIALVLIAVGILLSFLVKLAQKYLAANHQLSKAVAAAVAKGTPAAAARTLAASSIPHGWSFALKETVSNKSWAYLGITALVVVAIFTAWQGYYSNLAAFGRSPLDLIAAFLFGFGSLAILNQAIELLK